MSIYGNKYSKQSKTLQEDLWWHQQQQYNTKKKKNVDVEIKNYFYSCNIPFHTTGNNWFESMISKLRLDYEPPNHVKLAGDLLDKIHSETGM